MANQPTNEDHFFYNKCNNHMTHRLTVLPFFQDHEPRMCCLNPPAIRNLFTPGQARAMKRPMCNEGTCYYPHGDDCDLYWHVANFLWHGNRWCWNWHPGNPGHFRGKQQWSNFRLEDPSRLVQPAHDEPCKWTVAIFPVANLDMAIHRNWRVDT